MKATNVAFILAFWVAGILADPETVKGLLKKNTNSWNVPIVAKQANENNPTQVVGGYPKLELDTLARPLKSGEITSHLFLNTYAIYLFVNQPHFNLQKYGWYFRNDEQW